MTYDMLYRKIVDKAYAPKVAYPDQKRYPETHIFDEDKSVKWNKQEVKMLNDVRDSQIKAYEAAQAEGELEFKEDVMDYVLDEYNLKDNRAAAELIYSQAYREGHSGGFSEILGCASELASFAADILACVESK